MLLQLPNRIIDFSNRRPLLMGIVNVNDDSFSGDGTLNISEAIKIARKQVSEGADIIDVGAESAGTNREAITAEEEIRRFGAFLEQWQEQIATLKPKDEEQIWPPILSANTWRSEVVEAVLPHQIEILNDISALPDSTNAELCSNNKAALLIMHSIGVPKIPNTNQQYDNLWSSIEYFFKEKIQLALNAGLKKEQLILDPGIDFAKQAPDNLTILRECSRLQHYELPVLLPISRKTVIGDVLGIPDATQRDAGTIACLVQGWDQQAQIFRVHNVAAAWQTLKVLHALK